MNEKDGAARRAAREAEERAKSIALEVATRRLELALLDLASAGELLVASFEELRTGTLRKRDAAALATFGLARVGGPEGTERVTVTEDGIRVAVAVIRNDDAAKKKPRKR
jgi:hypothetical protein